MKIITAYQPANCELIFQNFQTSAWGNPKKRSSYFSDGLSGVDNLKTPRGVVAIWKIKIKTLNS